MFDEKEENGKIRSTFFGIEDHGILTFNIDIEFDATGQGFGGYCLSKSTSGSEESITCFFKILETLEVYQWEKLPGTPVRVRRSDGRIEEIGHHYKDQWFNIKDHFKPRKTARKSRNR